MVLLQNMMIRTDEQISALTLWGKVDGDTICMKMKLSESKSLMDEKPIKAAVSVLAKGDRMEAAAGRSCSTGNQSCGFPRVPLVFAKAAGIR